MKKKETRKKSEALVKSNENGVVQSYIAWIADLKRRYRATQIKAAIAVNSALIEFYWNLGKDISEKYPGKKRDAGFFHKLSMDLQCEIPDATGLSVTNIKYARYFFELYSVVPYRPQVVDDNEHRDHRPHVVDDKIWKSLQLTDENSHVIVQQVVAQLVSVPWGHHRTIIDKCKGDRDKAFFYVRRTIQNGWSRNSLLNWLSTDLYEREGKAQNNFEPVGLLICKEHNRILAKYHLEELGLPMGITDYELKKVLPTKAQLAKCVSDAEKHIAMAKKVGKQ